ncbi:borealin-like [Glandiceps talaboti]
MPRKRKTKLTKRTKPKLPTGDDSTDLSENERREKLELFLQDFDLEVETRIESMRKEAEKMCSLISSSYKMEVFKLPKSMKNMTRSEFVAKGGSISAVALEEASKTVDSMAGQLGSTLTKSTSNRVPLGNVGNIKSTEPPSMDIKIKEERLPSTDELSDTLSTQSSQTGTKRKRTKKTTVGKGRTSRKTQNTSTVDEQDSMSMPPPQAPTTVRRSARKAALNHSFITPAVHTGRHNAITAGWDTPAITPKFDPRLPVTPAVLREPKAGERIMSLAGSPLSNASHKGAAVPEAYIPLSDGQAIQLSANQDVNDINISQVDETTRKNLLLLQAKIAKILQQKQTTSQNQ